MFPSLGEFSMTVAYIIIFVTVTLFVFGWFCERAPLFDPGALIEIGVAGSIGLFGFIWRVWGEAAGVHLCFLGACIGSGMHRVRGKPSDNGKNH